MPALVLSLVLAGVGPAQGQDAVRSHHLDVTPSDLQTRAKSARGLTVDDAVQLRAGSQEGIIVSPVLRAPFPFNGLAPHWDADTPDEAVIDVEVRTSVDGDTWTPWTQTVHHHAVEPTIKSTGEPNPHAGDTAAGYVITETGSRYVQFRLTLRSGAAGSPLLRRMSLYLVNSTDGPSSPDPALDEEYNERLQDGNRKGQRKGATEPRIYTRDEWGAQAPNGSYSYYPADHLAIHHSASTSDGNADTWSECAEAVRGIQDFHMYTNGWIDIGYNYLVCQTGHIFQGREDGDDDSDVVGVHDTHNTGSVGVDGMGYFHPPYNQEPTQAMLDSYADLFAWIADRRDIDPDGASYYYGYGGTVDNVYGHRDVYGTACPGDNLYAEVNTIVNDVESILAGGDGLSLTATWQRNGAANGRPSWFATSGSTERGLAYGTVDGNERLYVVSRSSGRPKIHVLDANDGSDVTTMSTSGVSGGALPLNDIEASSDGVLFAANLVTDASQNAFKVYRWDGESDTPTTVISYKTSEALRLGDHITVTGSARNGTLELWAPASGDNKVLRFTTTNGYFQASTVTTGSSFGGAPSVGAFSRYFFVGASGQGAASYDDDGSVRGSVPSSAIPNTTGGLKTFADFSGSPIRKYAAVFDYVSGSAHGGRLRLVDVTDGAASAVLEDDTPWFGGADNPYGTGDVAVRSNGDGTFTLFGLSTNNGLAAYTTTTSKALASETARETPPPARADNYPNPVRRTTHVDLRLRETASVRVDVYDMLGRRVQTRRFGSLAAGKQTLTLRVGDLTSGTYLYRVRAGDRTLEGRMSVVQ